MVFRANLQFACISHVLWRLHPDRGHPERTLKSHLQMAYEAISRDAKLWWFRATGAGEVISLQHDGVVASLHPARDVASVARALTRVSSRALGYDQPVEHKPMPATPPRTAMTDMFGATFRPYYYGEM